MALTSPNTQRIRLKWPRTFLAKACLQLIATLSNEEAQSQKVFSSY